MKDKTISLILQRLKSHCVSTCVPCINEYTEHILKQIIYTHQPHRVLEIGSAYGYSLGAIAGWINTRGGVIVGCERAYPNRKEISSLLSLCRTYKLGNIHCIYQPFLSTDPSLFFSYIPFDMVFIDAQKSEYMLYVEYLFTHNLVGSNTLRVFDDVILYQEKIQGLENVLEKYGMIYQTILTQEGDGIMIAYKNDYIGSDSLEKCIRLLKE